MLAGHSLSEGVTSKRAPSVDYGVSTKGRAISLLIGGKISPQNSPLVQPRGPLFVPFEKAYKLGMSLEGSQVEACSTRYSTLFHSQVVCKRPY